MNLMLTDGRLSESNMQMQNQFKFILNKSFFNIINAFTATFDQLSSFLLHKNINFFQKWMYPTYPHQTTVLLHQHQVRLL